MATAATSLGVASDFVTGSLAGAALGAAASLACATLGLGCWTRVRCGAGWRLPLGAALSCCCCAPVAGEMGAGRCEP